MNGQPVEDLLAEFSATGQQQVFEEIVRRYAGLVFGVCLRTCKDAHDAEDATQAVFLSLAVQCKSGNAIRHLPAWLRQVAKRTSLDVRKARKRREAREARRSAETNGVVNDRGDDRPSAMDLQEIGHVLSEELAKLPAKYRLPLVSLYFGGLSREEIAEQLGLKPGALGVRIHRARAMLGERLKRRGAYPDGAVLAVGMAPMLDHAFGGALSVRTAEAAARLMLGHDLGGAVSGNVLSLMTGTAGAISIGRLKVVASVLLLLASVASGGGVVVKSTDAVPQVVSQVRKWITDIRGALTMPSLDLRADASTDVENGTLSERDRLALAPQKQELQYPTSFDAPLIVSQSSADVATPDGPVVGTVPPALTGPGSASAPAAPPGGIRFPEVYALTSTKATTTPPPVARKLPYEGKPDTVATARPAAGGGGPAVVRATVAPRPPVSTSHGSVTTSAAAAEGSRWIEPDKVRRGTVDGPTLAVGAPAGSKGRYTLEEGTLVAGAESIGAAGDGTFVQTGGTNVVTQLVLGDAATGSGKYLNYGGSIEVSARDGTATPGIVVGGEGRGELVLGSETVGGLVKFIPVTVDASTSYTAGITKPMLIVRASAKGNGVLRGWGRVEGGGAAGFVNNGQTIADGLGADRDLTFGEFVSIGNTIDNGAVQGANGWYAYHGGQLTMPATAGTDDSFTWGENPTDASLDMVNSVRMVIEPPPDALTVSLLAPDRTDIPTLPAGHSFIGVWSLDMGAAAAADRISVTVRYDDLLASSMGLNESNLKLWRYDAAAGWSLVTGDNFWRNAPLNLIGGNVGGTTEYFAVSAPEPTGLVTLIAAGAGLLLRRRRRG